MGKAAGANVRVRFTPNKKNTLMTASGSVYGGRAQTEVVFLDNSDTIRLKSVFSGIQIEKALSSYLGKAAARGAARGELAFTADSSSQAAFKRTVRGTASIALRNGAFIMKPGGQGERIQFDSFDVTGKISPSKAKTQAGILFYDSHWNGIMKSGEIRMEAMMEGRFGVRESSGHLVFEGMKTTCAGKYAFPFLYNGKPVKFTGNAVVSYDQQQASAIFDSCFLALPDFSLSGNARGKNIHDEKSLAWTGKLRVRSGKARTLLTALGSGAALPPGGLNAMELEAAYAITADEMIFSDCRLHLDKSVARGGVRAHKRRDSTPAFDASVVIDTLDWDVYFPKSAETGKNEAYDFSWLRSLNAKGRLAINEFHARRLSLSRMTCNFLVENEMIAVFFDSLSYGGQVRGEWRASLHDSGKGAAAKRGDAGALAHRFALSGKGINLEQLSQNLFGDIYLGGKMAFSGDFTGTVRRFEDILGNCAGNWTISAEKGFFCSSGTQQAKEPRGRNSRSMAGTHSGAA